MFKRTVILLTFLSYFLTLVHSLVPHHHHDGSKIAHHQGSDTSDHHHEPENENNSISHVFAYAIHHPASDVVIHSRQFDIVQKNKQSVDVLIFTFSQLLFPELKPPDIPIPHQGNHYSSEQDSFFLLRAPPVV